MPSYVPPVKNAGAIFYLGLPSMGVAGSVQVNPTLAAGDVRVSVDGGALANITILPVVTPAASPMVKVTLSAAETNGDNIAILFVDQTAPKEWCDTVARVQTAAANLDTIAAKTNGLPAAPAAVSDVPTANQNADALLDRSAGVETGLTLRQFARLAAAVLFGKASGMATTTAIFRSTTDGTNRVTATVDVDGNRSAVTLDPS